MTAFDLNVNDNVVSIALALITLLTLVFNSKSSSRAAKASESAAGQLKNNGGSTALDKLERGQREILTRIGSIDERLDSHDEQFDRILNGGNA